jgi:DNA-3-methyladenine glycosylase I
MTDPGRPPEPGPDGRLRCPWALSAPEELPYHDEEWGRPVRDDRGIFERLCLEAFQSGLSWLTILRKRENFRAAFGGFDPAVVAGFGPDDVTRLLGDAGIIRNRAKITAVIGNAQAALAVPGGLAALVWGYAEDPAGAGSGAPVSTGPATTAEIPAWTPASQALARELKGYGFAFTGPVTVYATFQACGVVDDHLRGCFRRGAYRGHQAEHPGS